MKKILYILVLIISQNLLYAQSFEEYKKQAQKEYSDFKTQREKEFTEFRNKINSEFADFMRGKWDRKEASKGEDVPELPEPPKPNIADPDDVPTKKTPRLFGDIVAPPVKIDQPEPIVPIPGYKRKGVIYDDDEEVIEDDKKIRKDDRTLPLKDRDNTINLNKEINEDLNLADMPERRKKQNPAPTGNFKFKYFGSDCAVNLDNSLSYKLNGCSENNIADGWLVLSGEKYNDMLNDCLAWRNKLKLCDWGYFLFTKQLTESFCTLNKKNEARLMQMYILTQSGYQVRMARTGNKIVLCIPFEADVYKYNYLTINNQKFYIVDSEIPLNSSFYIFNKAFPKEQTFSLTFDKEPIFAENKTIEKYRSFDYFSSNPLKFNVNGNLMDFYNEFPRCNNWNLYSLRSLSSEAKDVLYPELIRAIKGKSEAQAANIIISFVQHSFDYKTDDAQFGYERSLFADETIYYPYSDCEDRSIIFSVIIRDLLGLDVVLINYPGHLATAVKFNESVNGDYFSLSDGQYTVCDPTFIGASIGQTMPQYKNSSPKIIQIQ